ncbi:MAG: SDR family NAD(P)-dependent oxidoreductase [Bacteroidetes bacterium]|nr:SDR family NAD(P)-dependent oxidoreductase [Bacteroidota bacterium]
MVERSTENGYALITGGSQGIGKQIALELASRGYNILIVALHHPNIAEAKADILSKYDIKVDTISVDLTEISSAQEVFDWCNKEGYKVQILVNNAGFGYAGAFESYNHEFYDNLMKINMVAPVNLCRLFLDDLKSFSRGYILNIGSAAAYSDMPFKTVYAATKKFLYGFTLALREELRDTGVSLTIICPSGVATNASVMQNVKDMGAVARLSTTTPEHIAHKAVKGMFARKTVIVPLAITKLYVGMVRLLPRGIMLRMIGNKFRKSKVKLYKTPQQQNADDAA